MDKNKKPYPEWKTRFLELFHSNNLNAKYVDDLTRYCLQVSKNNSLSPPNENDTNEFIDVFLPMIIDNILQTRTVNFMARYYNKILEISVKLLRKLIVSDHESFISTARQIIEKPNSPYYSFTFNASYNTSELYLTLCTTFAQSSTINNISQYFDNLPELPISKIKSIIEIFVPISGYFNIDETSQFIVKFLPLCSNKVNSIDIREINETEVGEIFSTIELFDIPSEIIHQVFMHHIQFLMKFVKSDQLTKQFSSLNQIKEIIIFHPDKISPILQSFSLIHDLLNTDIHVKLIDSFSTIFSIMCERGCTTKDDLTVFWRKTLEQPQSTLPTFLSGIRKATDKMDPNEPFLHIILETGKLPDCILDYIGFLSFKCRSVSMKKLMFDALMKEYNNRRENESENDLALLIKTIGLYVCAYDPTFCEEQQKKCIENIENEKDVRLSLHILKCTFQNASSEDAHTYFNVIINKIDKNESFEYLNLLIQILQKYQTTLSKEEFEQIQDITMHLSSDQVIDFYTSLIDDAVTRVPLLDHEMKLAVLKYFCDMNYSQRVFNFIQTLYYQFNTSQFEGVQCIWNFLFKTNRYEVSTMLIRQYMNGNNIASFIQSCSQNFNLEGSLISLIRFIHLLQDGIDLQPGPNNFFFEDDYVNITLFGDIQYTLRLQNDTCYNGFQRRIEQLTNVASSQISLYVNNQAFTKSSYYLLDKMSIQVRIATNQPIRRPQTPQYTFPSQILVQSQYYQALLNVLCESDDPKISNFALQVLNLLPTSQEILNELNTDVDWDEFLCIDMPYLLLYKLNMICNCVTNNSQIYVPIFYPNGMTALLFIVFNVASSIFADNQTLISFLKFVIYLLNFHAAISYKAEIIESVKDSIPALLLWIQNVADDDQSSNLLGYLMQFLNEFQSIAQSFPEFTALIQKTIFHKTQSIQVYALRLIESMQSSQQMKEDLLLPLLSEAHNNSECDEYFTILVKILETTKNADSIFNLLVENLYNHCSIPRKGTILDILQFMPPPVNYTHGLFKAMNAIISKVSTVPEMRKLFDFIRNEIIFNEYKYYQPTTEVFEVFMYLLDKDPSFNEILKPTLDACKEFRLSQATDNYELSATARDRGIRNMGATCYINSTIQQLYNIKKFRESLLMHAFDVNDWSFEFQYVFAKLALFPSKYIDIINFLNKWKGYDNEIVDVHQQQDSVEFLQLLLDRLEKIMPKTISIFQGEIEHKTIYDENNISTNIENFTIFPLDVKNQESIEDSLKNFLVPDRFEYTTETKLKREAIRLHKMKKAPEVLIIQLKRFEFNLQKNQREKINSQFKFTPKLDLSSIMSDSVPIQYELCGVVQHCGTAMGGHYFSDVKKGINNWLCINDTVVSKIDEDRLLFEAAGGNEEIISYSAGYQQKARIDKNSNAYLLFYKQISNENDSSIKLVDTELIKASLEQMSIDSFVDLDEDKQIDGNEEGISMKCPGFNSKIIDRLLPEIKTTILRAVCNSHQFSQLLMNICQNNPNGDFLYSHFTNCLRMQSDHQGRLQLIEKCNNLFKTNPQFCDRILSEYDDFIEFAIRNSNIIIRQDYLSLIDKALASSSNESLLKFHTYYLTKISVDPAIFVSNRDCLNPFFTIFEKTINDSVEKAPLTSGLLAFLINGPALYDKNHPADMIYTKIDLSYPLKLLAKYSTTNDMKRNAISQLIEASSLIDLTKSIYHQVSYNEFLSSMLTDDYCQDLLIQYLKKNESKMPIPALASIFNALVSIQKEEIVKNFLKTFPKPASIKLFFENILSIPNKNPESYINVSNLIIDKFLITKDLKLRNQTCDLFHQLLPQFPSPPIGKIEGSPQLPLLDTLFQHLTASIPHLNSFLENILNEQPKDDQFPSKEFYDLYTWVIISGGFLDQLNFSIMMSTLKQYGALELDACQFHLFNMLANLFGNELFNHMPMSKVLQAISSNRIMYIFENLIAIIPVQNSLEFIKSPAFITICRSGFPKDSQHCSIDVAKTISTLTTPETVMYISQALANSHVAHHNFLNINYLRCCWKIMKKYPLAYQPFYKEDIHIRLFELIFQGNLFERSPHLMSRPLSKWIAVFNNAFYDDNKDKKVFLVKPKTAMLFSKYESIASDLYYNIESIFTWIVKNYYPTKYGNFGYIQLLRSLIKLSSTPMKALFKKLTQMHPFINPSRGYQAAMLVCDICSKMDQSEAVDSVILREFQAMQIIDAKSFKGFEYFFAFFANYEFHRNTEIGLAIKEKFLSINDIRLVTDSFTNLVITERKKAPLFDTNTTFRFLEVTQNLISNEIKISLRTGITADEFKESVVHIEKAFNFVDKSINLLHAAKRRLQDVDSNQLASFIQQLKVFNLQDDAQITLSYLQ